MMDQLYLRHLSCFSISIVEYAFKIVEFFNFEPIANTAWVRNQLCKLQKGFTRLAAMSDTVYQLLAHGQWFSLGTPASSTTKTGHHDIATGKLYHLQLRTFY
jgi:hypothetical protein